MRLLEVQDVSTGYGKKQVLFKASFEMKKGETVLLFGSNGSGKSSLLKVVFGLLKPWNKDAKIWFKNEEISNFKPYQLLKKGMVYIPQKNELFDDLSVKENLEISGMQTFCKKELLNRISNVLQHIPILVELSNQKCSRLSGGERKLVSLAMALINKPEIILYDEPLAGISPKNLKEFVKSLKRIKNMQVSLLLVEHRTKNLLHLADKIIQLKLGRLSKTKFNSVIENTGVM